MYATPSHKRPKRGKAPLSEKCPGTRLRGVSILAACARAPPAPGAHPPATCLCRPGATRERAHARAPAACRPSAPDASRVTCRSHPLLPSAVPDPARWQLQHLQQNFGGDPPSVRPKRLFQGASGAPPALQGHR